MAFRAGKCGSSHPATAEASFSASSVAPLMSTMRCFDDQPLDVVATPTSSPTFQPISAGSCLRNSSVEPLTAVRLSNVQVRFSGTPWIIIELASPPMNLSP